MENTKILKETPILFSTEMVKAILNGKKTQTRRVLKPQPEFFLESWEEPPKIIVGPYHPTVIDKDGFEQPGDMIFGAYTDDGEWGWKCPYGDLLWVRETHFRYHEYGKKLDKEVLYMDNPSSEIINISRSDTPLETSEDRIKDLTRRKRSGWIKMPSIFMPKWACRIWLEITDVRVERVQDIKQDDCVKEGIARYTFAKGVISDEPPDSRWAFIKLWDFINLKRGYGWDKNPWVWVIEFKVRDRRSFK